MNVPLQFRFYEWAAPFNIFLQCYGVDLHQLNQSSKARRNFIRFWSWFLLILHILGLAGQYIDRLLLFKFNLNNINWLMSRTNMLVTCLLATSFVVFLASSRLVSIIEILEEVDRSLNRPNLSSLYRSSVIGIIWILITVNFECCCAILHELNRKHLNALHVIQQIIKFQGLAPLMTTILIYAIFTQLLVIYYRQLATNIEQNNRNIAFSVRIYSRLQNATELMHNHLQFYMDLNCLFFLVNLIQTVYNMLVYDPFKNTLLLVWNIFATTDMCIRLWVICHSADRIRDAALNCVYAARRLRSGSMKILPPKQRKRIIFFIYEVNQQVLRTNRIPLGRSIIFTYTDYIVSFALLLWESRTTLFTT